MYERIKALEAATDVYGQSRKPADKSVARVEKYGNFDTLITTVLLGFVETILAHERESKRGFKTTQQNEIFSNLVGRHIPPRFEEASLTVEKPEESRGSPRLVAPRAKRPAAGARATHEDGQKGRGGPEKSALRTGDIRKGVFVSVSHLPRSGPARAGWLAGGDESITMKRIPRVRYPPCVVQ